MYDEFSHLARACTQGVLSPSYQSSHLQLYLTLVFAVRVSTQDNTGCSKDAYGVSQGVHHSGYGETYLVASLVSVILFLGVLKQRPLMQLSQVSSQFAITLSCYLNLGLYSLMCAHILLLVLMLHMSPLLCLFVFPPSQAVLQWWIRFIGNAR